MKLFTKTWVSTKPKTQILACYSKLMTLVIAAADQETCLTATQWFLKALGDLGYRDLAKKTQICKQQAMYLGYVLKGGQQQLLDAQKETLLKILVPTAARQGREFLGTVGFCHYGSQVLLNWPNLYMRPLLALWKPNKEAIIHCLGHQKGNEPIPRGNNLADKTAQIKPLKKGFLWTEHHKWPLTNSNKACYWPQH